LVEQALDSACVQDIVNLLAVASFCPFGKGVANSFGSLLKKILN